MLSPSDQDGLHANLERRNAKLARIYRGGLIVLADEANPCRFELAAHSFRELIEKSPILTNGALFPSGDGVDARIVAVRKAHNAVTRGQKFAASSTLDASEGLLRDLVHKLDVFFEWKDSVQPNTRKRNRDHLAALFGSGPALPDDLFKENLARWEEAREFFVRVAHNRQDEVDQTAFIQHMNFVERVLLRALQPRSVDQINELDALIRQAENGH